MYDRTTIRKIITDMRKMGAHLIYFHGYKNPISVYYGRPSDRDCVYSYSYWKKIDGVNVCRNVHCFIPEELRIPEVERYGSDGEYVLPERVFNLLLSYFQFDYTRTISDRYYMYVDSLSMSDW